MSDDAKFDELKQRLIDKFLEKNPGFASFLGLHDPYDHLLPKGDTHHVIENLELLEECVSQMKSDVNFNTLNEGNKIDWQVLEKAVDETKFEVHEIRQHELNPNAFDVIGSLFFGMITRDYAPLEKRVEAVVARLQKLPQYLEEFRSRFENSKPVRLWVEIAIESAQQMPGLFQFIVSVSKGQISEDLHKKLAETTAGLMPAFQEHMKWLENLKSKTVENWALGKEKFEKLIQLRGLGMTSQDILELGRKYLERLKEKRTLIAAEIAPGKDVSEVMKSIEKDAPKTFEEAIGATREAMEEAKRFVIENKIAAVHEEDKLIVEETPAFIAPLIPFAALMMPSRFDKPMIGVYVVTRPKDLANLGNHLNYASVRNTAVHEAYPGHFLQGSISNRSSLIHLFSGGTETTEGWAHYCEQMMMERGFVSGPKSKLMQVNDGIWRAVRIIVDVGLSRGEMSFDDAVDMLAKEAGMSKEAAVAEVRRYTQSPGYPLSYLLGKHLILGLREEIKRKMGNKYTDRFFHDTITANGYLSITLLRAVFDQKIAKLET
ncbi:MAG: DUF885 domain-containing protein [Candidatus Bathyarchaeota archaeon]|nr:MAG: DUF885 domain-containing protein [Candidatus Bathyarchaeota archaeon]